MELMIREAKAEDASTLAELMNIAGEGIPAYLWQRMASAGEDVMVFGARRVAQPEGGFSYTNAHVALGADEIVGMMLGYRLDDPHEIGSLNEIPAVVLPLLELEAQAPGSWYINAVATNAAYRGQGVGRKLMELAEQLAAASCSKSLSLIVAEENAAARRLYKRLGYRDIDKRPIVPCLHCPHTGNWILMMKETRFQAI